MRLPLRSYGLLVGLLLLPLALCAQEPAQEASVLDETTRLEIEGRLNLYLEGMQRICNSCKAKLPMAGDAPITNSYISMQNYRLRTLEKNLKSLEIRWNNYYPMQQWEISQDEGLMAHVEQFELMKQEAMDSLEVRKQMMQAVQDFADALDYMEGLDSTYNSLGKQAFELSLTSKTAALLEKQKKKEELIFASVQEKYDKAKMAGQLNMVSGARISELEDTYASIKAKSDTIQTLQYKPLIQRIKDYLLSFAAVAVLLMFVNMLHGKIKAAKQMRESIKKYKDTLKLNGNDEYPTI